MSKRRVPGISVGCAILALALWTSGVASPDRSDESNSPLPASADRDRDGLPDALEIQLANRFAPIVFYDPGEPNFPSRVDRFFPSTHLWFFSKFCLPAQSRQQEIASEIPRQSARSCRTPEESIASHGTRSSGKEETFYLETVAQPGRRGSPDPQDWLTYVHSYPNDAGGVTLQYWRFYTFNTSY